MLDDLKLTDQYNAIKLFNYKTENMKEFLMRCQDSFIVINNADILIDDGIRRFINFEFSNQYMLSLRNCNGLNSCLRIHCNRYRNIDILQCFSEIEEREELSCFI